VLAEPPAALLQLKTDAPANGPQASPMATIPAKLVINLLWFPNFSTF